MTPRHDIIRWFSLLFLRPVLRRAVYSTAVCVALFALLVIQAISPRFAGERPLLLVLALGLHVYYALHAYRWWSTLMRARRLIVHEAPLMERLIDPRMDFPTGEIIDMAERRYCFAAALSRFGLRMGTTTIQRDSAGAAAPTRDDKLPLNLNVLCRLLRRT